MGEPKGGEAELLGDTFIEAYNGLHGTKYGTSGTKPTEPTDLLFDDPSGSNQFIWSPTAAAFIIDVASQAWAAMEAKADRYGSSAETFVSDGADRQDVGATAQLRHELHLGAAAKRVADDGLDDRPIFGSFVTNDDIDHDEHEVTADDPASSKSLQGFWRLRVRGPLSRRAMPRKEDHANAAVSHT